MNSAMRRSSLLLLQRRVVLTSSSLSESKTAVRQVHSTLGSTYANDMQQQQQQQHHIQYSSSTTATSAATMPPFLRMTTNSSSSSTPPSTNYSSTMDNDSNDVCDAYDFGYRVVSPFEAERYTATTCQSYDDGYYSAFKDEEKKQQKQHGRHRCWLIPFIALLVVSVCVVTARFTASTSVGAAFFLRRPTTGLLQKQNQHEEDQRENGAGYAYGSVSSDFATVRLWQNPQHRLLQNDNMNASSSIQAAAAAACPTTTTATAAEEGTGENPFSSTPMWVQYVLIIVLLAISSMFSGLTLGLMGLDLSGLEIIMDGDNPVQAKQARLIYSIRKNGNLLLCTLIIGNVAVNALLSILTAENFGGLVGFLVSTVLIVIFGEIAPQAACARYSLQVGSRAVPLMRVVIFLMLPVTYPLAWCLDKILGEELATTYSNAEMLKLLAIHVREEVMDPDTAAAMGGALRYKSMLVREVMTTMDKTFMLSAEDKLNFEIIAHIFKTGYSRIPVYKVSKNNVIGLLFVKDLIFIDPEDSTRVEDFVNIFGRGLHVVWPDDSLGDVLRELKKGKSHMALVRDVNNADNQQDPYYEIKGIITLEDIIEEILGEEIVDETDPFVDNSQMSPTEICPVMRPDGSMMDAASRWGSLRLLDTKIVDETLSHDETRAVVAHLTKNYARAFGNNVLLTENQLYQLVAKTPVSLLPTAPQEIGQEMPSSEDLLYEKGVPNDFCTIILSGKVTVLVGADNFHSDVSSWSVLAADAMTGGTSGTYKPDFSAFVSAGPCRCLRISQAKFSQAVDSSAVERQEVSHVHHNSSGSGSPAMKQQKASHVRHNSSGGSSISTSSKLHGKTIGTGTSTSSGAIVLGGITTKGIPAEGTEASDVIATGASDVAVIAATPDGASALPPIMNNNIRSNKKQRFLAALKVTAGEVPPQATPPPPPSLDSTP